MLIAMNKHFAALVMTMCMVVGMVPGGMFGPVTVRAGVGDLVYAMDENGDEVFHGAIGYSISAGDYTIGIDGVYEVESGSGIIIVAPGVDAVLVLGGIIRESVSGSGVASRSPLQIGSGATVTIVLVDGTDNTFSCKGTASATGSIQAGIYVPTGATLIIRGQENNTGTLTATGGRYSTGIGSGANYGCGDIIIEGGTVIATSGGSDALGDINAAGIGGGGTGTAGASGTITISGSPTIVAKTMSTQVDAEDIGAGISDSNVTGVQADVIITGGNVYAENIAFAKNGVANGNEAVEMITVAPKAGSGASLSYNVPKTTSGTYTYEAIVNGVGKAYLWMPITAGLNDIDLVPATTGTAYDTMLIDVIVEHGQVWGTVEKIEWFKVDLSDTTPYNNPIDFNTEYTNAEALGKAGTSPLTTDEREHTFSVPANENAIYWIKVEFTESDGAVSSVFKQIIVNNIRTSATVTESYKTTSGATIQTQTTHGSAIGVGETYIRTVPTISGYTVMGWYKGNYSGSETYVTNQNTNFVIASTTEDVTFIYSLNSSGNIGGGSSGTIINNGNNGGTVVINSDDEDEVALASVDESKPRPPVSDHIKSILETEEHIKYIQGYSDGTVKPDANITRGEVASIFWKLIKSEEKNSPIMIDEFSVVNGDEWYAKAVYYLASIDVISGYEDGIFRPTQSITRAEFAAIASRFDELDLEKTSPFADVSDDHWAHSYIVSACVKGWINGYPGGLFLPNNNITRGETVTIVNYMIGRGIRADDVPRDLYNIYTDLSTNHWAFAEVVEASVEHEYERIEDGYEVYISW